MLWLYAAHLVFHTWILTGQENLSTSNEEWYLPVGCITLIRFEIGIDADFLHSGLAAKLNVNKMRLRTIWLPVCIQGAISQLVNTKSYKNRHLEYNVPYIYGLQDTASWDYHELDDLLMSQKQISSWNPNLLGSQISHYWCGVTSGINSGTSWM